MKAHLRILLVEDSEDDAELVLRAIRSGGYDVAYERVFTAQDMIRAVGQGKWDIVISDYSMPQFDALHALSVLKQSELDIPFLIVSGTIGEDTAVAAMKAGASDYIMKSNLARLVPAIEREIRENKNRLMLREKEEQLILSQKLEGIGRLASGIAHDFNNHLAVIIMSADLIMSDMKDSELKSEIEEIKTAGERASELTKQLLAFCRKQVLQPRVIQLNNVVSEMDKMFHRLIREDIKLETHLDSKLGNIKADPTQIEQVLMNLVVNARDAMPQGGKLSIETKNIIIDETYIDDHVPLKPGPHAMLIVSDTGVGMNAETKAKIFEPFFTTKKEHKGTGLGLATTYGIVRQSGGDIRVYSELGKGTTMKVSFPCVNEEADVAATKVPQPKMAKKATTILLVEDKEPVRRLVRKILEGNGYHILEASSGPEAIEISSKYKDPIHLMVTDVIMPEMKGQEVAQRLKPTRPSMKVLYISGYTDNTFAHYGIVDLDRIFLPKPFTQKTLINKVNEVLENF